MERSTGQCENTTKTTFNQGYQSRASIRRSVDAGVSILELDFRLTKDGHIGKALVLR